MTLAERPEIGGIIMFSEDITALKETLESESALRATTEVQTALRVKAEEESKTKDDFVATLSHELRSPLNAMLGWIQLAKRAPHDLARRERAFGAIEHSAQLLARLISDILDISRITSRKLRLDIQDASVETVLERSFEIALPLAESKGIKLTRGTLPVQASLRADSQRLLQSLSNLLANAVKFTPQGGHITLSSRVLDHTIQITVCDDGQGISPEMLPHIFERFVQADLSSTRVHGGLGLGLAITRHLIEPHGGTVTAHSGGEGKGSTFTLTLPLPTKQRATPALASASSLHTPRI